ncbi:MAG: endopeptidase La [Bacteroidetes bacterium GWF2_41_61]|nr:MAG: endopeptidase La [Bacteroidetes bacterium GWE2_40_15]OFY36779.1 MAG: endopeptidase La [Bacteroidetes bacterium GWF2_41_61]OFY91371.1 MAG: endopeptidase La [Bacteroidetes bacterium RIFOXYA12_FULL_40_10]HBZ25815.1 endopeptidase La [Rikenellaceae bacterium]
MKFSDIFVQHTVSDEVNIIPMMSLEGENELNESELPDTLPIIALRNAVLFPETIIPITVGREKSIKLVREAYSGNKILGAVSQKDAKMEDPKPGDLFDIGTLAKIIKIIEMPDGGITIILQGMKRFRVLDIIGVNPYITAKVKYLDEERSKSTKELEAIASSIKDLALHIIKLSPHLPQEAAFAIKNIEGYSFLVNFISSSMELESISDKIALLRENKVKQRALKLLEILNRQIDLLKIKDDIQQKVRSEIDQQQKEYYLNSQLKTIQEELGINSNNQEFVELRQQAIDKIWPQNVSEIFEKEIQRLERSNPNSPDFNVQLSYVRFLVELPWSECSKDNLDLKHAQKVLDEDHFGLESVKDRIIEHLAVLKLKGDMKSPILCLYGPPGVGKTSLGKSIAKALGRKYGRISLGGLHDESEIRGHRRTYIGAMPGRIISTLKKSGTSNPLIVLDEIDKVSSDFRGDPASALLEVLDPEQNTAFHDNYLDIDYNLSNVLFITTANNVSSIHPALKDRMELINVSGYLAEEKRYIAKDHLIPKQIEAHGLVRSQLKINKQGIDTIINEYTRESGVRGLDRQIAKIARVTAKRVALGESRPAVIGNKEVKEILGLPVYQPDVQKGNEASGVVTGLAWTQNGGEILFIECSLSKGKGILTTTGNLGDVMKESATIAYQYLKANPHLMNMTNKEFSEKDIHIHVPEGAIPKDGPSAGITMVSAMASAYMKSRVKSGIAMTGEITLRGKVLPVGGIKEKILAAKRAGIKIVILPADNEKDVKDIKEIYLKGLTFKYMSSISDVVEFIF